MPETPCSSGCCCCVCLAGLGRLRPNILLQLSLQVAGPAPPATRSLGWLAQTAAEAQHERLQGSLHHSCPWACRWRSKAINALLGVEGLGSSPGWAVRHAVHGRSFSSHSSELLLAQHMGKLSTPCGPAAVPACQTLGRQARPGGPPRWTRAAARQARLSWVAAAAVPLRCVMAQVTAGLCCSCAAALHVWPERAGQRLTLVQTPLPPCRHAA